MPPELRGFTFALPPGPSAGMTPCLGAAGRWGAGTGRYKQRSLYYLYIPISILSLYIYLYTISILSLYIYLYTISILSLSISDTNIALVVPLGFNLASTISLSSL